MKRSLLITASVCRLKGMKLLSSLLIIFFVKFDHCQGLFWELFLIFYFFIIKVATRVKKTDFFKKGWDFINPTCITSCNMKKTFFHHRWLLISPWNFFYSAELFEYASKFNLCLISFIFFNTNTNQTSEKKDLNFVRRSHLFWEQPLIKVWKVKSQACNITRKWTLLWTFLEILVLFFGTAFWQNIS